MMKVREIKTRCLVVFCLDIVGILASREMGTSQHLRIIRGAERESAARKNER